MKPVSVVGVTRRFGSFVAVRDVDLDVERGEVVGLVGANGAGKTTLIRMILGLLEPSAGAIRLFGERQSRAQRRRVGYVPQNLGLYRDLTATENLSFSAATFGVVPASLPTATEDALVAELALGLRRRIAFAAATQHDPDLLVLDEPTSGVSPLARSLLWDEIHLRAESGAAVLVSTHYMDEADQADRVVLMASGRVAGRGSISDIVGDTTTIVVEADDWSGAFGVLDRGDRLVTMAGTTIRVIGDSIEAVRAELAAGGVAAGVREAPATLDETMVVLGS